MSDRKILIIDDSQDICAMLSAHFRRQFGCSVTTANSVDEAEPTLRTQEFDLVVSDFRMPGRDGFEVARVLKDANKYFPLLFYTGDEISKKLLRELDYPVAVVAKPHYRDLMEIAANFLSSS